MNKPLPLTGIFQSQPSTCQWFGCLGMPAAVEAFRAATTTTRVVHKEVVHSSVCASSQDLTLFFKL